MTRLSHMSDAEASAFRRDPEAFTLALRFAARAATQARFDTRVSVYTNLMQLVEQARGQGVQA